MRNKPIYEYSDKRMSVRYAVEQKRREQDRLDATKKMGNNYFTNSKEVFDEVGRSN